MGRTVRKALSVCSAFVLSASLVLAPCQAAYAASAAPAIDVEGGLSYLIQMLSSSLGVQVSKASVPALWVAVDAQAKANDPKYMEELRGYCEDNSLISTRELDPSFCNQLLKDLRSIFISSGDYGTDAVEYIVPVFGGATYFSSETQFEIRYKNGTTDTFTDVISPSGVYLLPVAGDNAINVHSSPGRGVGIYLVGEESFDCFVNGVSRVSEYGRFLGNNAYFVRLASSSGDPDALSSRVYTIPYPWVKVGYNPVVSDTVDTSIFIEKALAAIQAQALAHPPAITKPVSIPADDTALKSNLAGVQAADDADALYKALAGAGISIDMGTDIPDETEKPTTGETTDDGTAVIGKSLSDILAAITGLADKVAAIPKEIAGFFTPDTVAIAESFDSLKGALLLKFGGISQLADVFSREYSFGTEVPVIKVPIPDQGMMRTMFDGKTGLVVLDLTPLAPYFPDVRNLLTAMLYVGFAFWFLDEFDVKIHIG